MPLEETLLQQLPKLGGKASSTNSKLDIYVDQGTVNEPINEYQEIDTYPFTSFVYKNPLVPEYAIDTLSGSPDVENEEYHGNVHIGEQGSVDSNDQLATKNTHSKGACGDTSVTFHCKGHIVSASVNQDISINSQENLLASYKHADKLFSIPIRWLAKAGFQYCGIKDCVRCPRCGLKLKHWPNNADPLAEHHRLKPDCAFLREHNHLSDISETGDVHHQRVKTDRDCLLNNGHFTSVQYYLSEVDRIASFEHLPECENQSIRLDEAQISKMAREGLYATLSGTPVYVACSLCDTQFELDSYNSNKNKHRTHCRFKT